MNRTTVYFKPGLYRALKIKAATTDRSISALINEAVQEALREDAIDLEAARRRRREKGRPFEDFLKELKRDGLL
ncbi:MAG: CopG family transcriptional regulator [Terriglobia bacterium]